MKDQGFLYQIGLAPDDAATHGHGPSSWEVSRREFFKIGAAASGGLLLSMYWPSPAPAQVGAGVFEPNVFVRIGADGLVTFTSPECEMGQGSRTSLALIVTDELDADWSMVRIEQAPLDEKYGAQWTGGSTSIRTRWTELRQAGATARALLVAAAAQTWGVDPASCTTDRGVVVHPASGRKLPYGDVAEAAARLPAPSDVPLKDPKDFRLIGKPMGSVDIPAMTRGEAVYGMDLTLPGMRYAVIERCPVFGGKVARFDASRAEAVPGVLAVVEVEGTGRPHHVAAGVAVVGETTWAALSGRDALVVDWDEGPHASDNSAALSEQMHALTQEPCDVVFDQGDAETILADDADTIQAVYEMPFLSHAPMEPMNCTAHLQGNRCELWAPTQNPAANRGAVAKVLGLAPENVHVNIIMTGGAFGRRLQSDYAIEAALLSRAVGAPVKVVWTREDDMQHDFYRPVNLHRLAAKLDENGYPEALRHRISSTSLAESSDGPDAKEYRSEFAGASDMHYRVPNRRCEYVNVSAAIPRGAWRSVSNTFTAFAVESFIDELAAAAGKDPYQYRRDLIDMSVEPDPNEPFSFDPARLRGVLDLAAQKAGWGEEPPAGHGRGIACHYSFRTYAAEVIEASVEDGAVKIRRVVAAVDCGTVVNPDSGASQVQGGIIDGLSVAFHQAVTLRAGRVEQGNFDDYPLLRLDEAPASIEVHFVQDGAPPTGLGEPVLPPAAPALANALFAATGKRVRALPLAEADLRS